MKLNETIILKNLGECTVMVENGDMVLVSKDGVCYFVINPSKKRQDEECSYESVIIYGFTTEEIFKLIQPLYEDIINNLNKQYNIYNKLSKMVIEACSKTI